LTTAKSWRLHASYEGNGENGENGENVESGGAVQLMGQLEDTDGDDRSTPALETPQPNILLSVGLIVVDHHILASGDVETKL
jgi:hypothetical protein